jgi:ABC-type transport system involved in multi-copper enzyme maturation permease subunit
MILLLARKELTESLLSARFLIASLIATLLIVTATMVLSRRYEEQLNDYQNRVRQQEQFIDQYGHYNRLGWMSRQMRPPSYFQVLVLGIDREAQQENFISNPVAALLSRLDFVTIVTIIFSLMAILFSYDALSGEREAGTLRLLLATGTPRRSILLGKFLGGLTSVLIPFSLGTLAGFLSIALNPAVQLGPPDFAVLAALLFTSWLYIALFFSLGLLFSGLSRTSAQSVLKSLFAWVLLVLVVPNMSPFLAAEIYPLPSAARIEQERFSIVDTERDQILRTRSKELQEKSFADLQSLLALPRTEIESRIAGDPALRERYEEYSKASEEITRQVNRQQQAKAEKISETFEERSRYQEQLAKVLTSCSPCGNYVFAVTDLTETGVEADDLWTQESGEYITALWSYADTQYKKEKEKNPAYDSNDFLDLHGRPRFVYRPSSIAARFVDTAPQLGILMLFLVVFLSGAVAAFHRYDAR